MKGPNGGKINNNYDTNYALNMAIKYLFINDRKYKKKTLPWCVRTPYSGGIRHNVTNTI